ncbi:MULTISPECIES: cysteine desulfurase family protein [unclassified Aureimonas]|uniref:cysteine desulfurase family protein n=1 Tax=unclassified Aureimonas TaxID=2615206 RepID=UPI000702341F|nr:MULTISPECIES: aminotransferase class V-fold PLP-dependent enzyme [unclassified Aureimonas]KQT60404.1 hypothetical protein ASG62_07050 [Aureimonas sp. Leaf427]KQT79282.1 hypothetical protein ASG54_09650 [Aureimonas sp. Leaf460]
MAARRIYLDHNAGAPLLAEARAAMMDALETAGNPSSVHAEGRRARAIVERARVEVAALVGADPEAVVFTSGASEAAATCLAPAWLQGESEVTIRDLAVGRGDHAALREAGRLFPGRVTHLPLDADGRLDSRALAELIEASDPDDLPLLAVTLANSETGVVADLSRPEVRRFAEAGRLVVDAVQGAGRLPLDMKRLGCTALILSGHKIGAAQGVGAYVLGDPQRRPMPLLVGGGQEKGRRSGTEAVAAIASFGAAATVARARLASGEAERLLLIRRHLEARIDAMAGPRIVARNAERLPNTVLLSIPALAAETAQIAFDLQGIAVSAGSACSSGKVGASAVLKAMEEAGSGIDSRMGAIRVSFGYETGLDEIDAFADALAGLAGRAAMRLIDPKAA